MAPRAFRAAVRAHRRLVAVGVVFAIALVSVLVVTHAAKTAGEATPAAAMSRTLSALQSGDANALRTIASPDLEQASPDLGQAELGRRWFAEVGGFTATETSTYSTTASDSFVYGQTRGSLRSERVTLRVLLQRAQNGRWFANGISTE